MSYQEKRTVVSLISTILISVLYFGFVFPRYQEGTDNFSFWGSVILLYIPVQIVAKVIIYIIFSILNTITTQEEEPGFTDELDRLIELKSTRNFYNVFMLGFVLSMAALALNMPPSVMFVVLIFSIIAAGVMFDISQFYFYRRGV